MKHKTEEEVIDSLVGWGIAIGILIFLGLAAGVLGMAKHDANQHCINNGYNKSTGYKTLAFVGTFDRVECDNKVVLNCRSVYVYSEPDKWGYSHKTGTQTWCN